MPVEKTRCDRNKSPRAVAVFRRGLLPPSTDDSRSPRRNQERTVGSKQPSSRLRWKPLLTKTTPEQHSLMHQVSLQSLKPQHATPDASLSTNSAPIESPVADCAVPR